MKRLWKWVLALVLLALIGFGARSPVAKRMAGDHLEAGMGWMATGEYSEAQDEFKAATQLDPENAEAWFQLGNARFHLSDEVGSAEAFRRAVAIRPNYAAALKQLGALDFLHGRFTEAQDELHRYVKLQPGDPAGWRVLGDLDHEAGDRADAIQAATEYIKLKPDEADEYFFRAEEETWAGVDNQTVAADARKGLGINPRAWRGYLTLGRAELKMGRADDALRDLTTGLNTLPPASPDRATLLLLHSQAAAQSGHSDLATKDLENATRLRGLEQARKAGIGDPAP